MIISDISWVDLNEFVEWQQEKEGRSLTIEIGEPSDHGYFKIWVYDYNLETGQHVTFVDEIDLKGKKVLNERLEYERLKKIFEKDGNND